MTLLPGPYANEPGTHFTLSPVSAKINYQPSVELELVVWPFLKLAKKSITRFLAGSRILEMRKGLQGGPCLVATCHGKKFKSEPTAGRAKWVSVCIFVRFFFPFFCEPFSAALCPGRVAQPFFSFFFLYFFGRTLGRTLTGCWSLAHGNCLFKRAPLSFNGICLDMQTRGSAEERKINLKEPRCETKGQVNAPCNYRPAEGGEGRCSCLAGPSEEYPGFRTQDSAVSLQ